MTEWERIALILCPLILFHGQCGERIGFTGIFLFGRGKVEWMPSPANITIDFRTFFPWDCKNKYICISFRHREVLQSRGTSDSRCRLSFRYTEAARKELLAFWMGISFLKARNKGWYQKANWRFFHTRRKALWWFRCPSTLWQVGRWMSNTCSEASSTALNCWAFLLRSWSP